MFNLDLVGGQDVHDDGLSLYESEVANVMKEGLPPFLDPC